jgi:hypothetical protein
MFVMALLLVFGLGVPDSFFGAVNAERTAVGLHALEWNQDMAFYAARHNEDMAAADMIYHGDETDLGQFLGVRVGENVGRGGTVASLMIAFMDSPGHKAAILDQNYTEMGTASLQVDGYLYVTMVFRETVSEEATPAPVEVRPAVEPQYSVPPEPVTPAHAHKVQIIEPVVLAMIPPHFLEGIDR